MRIQSLWRTAMRLDALNGATTTPPPGGSGSCTVIFRTDSAWNGGYNGTVTVTAGGSAVSRWTVTMTMPSGQSVVSLWNGTPTTSGSTVTVRNAAWNGSLAAGASTGYGFTAGGGGSVPTVTGCSAS
ncbi:cellulose binding domain-containing protein [Streptomyces sp. NPDC002644]